jgi:hypothetical protein
MHPRGYSPAWLAAGLAAAAALILGAPFIGQLRTILRAATGGSFASFMAIAVSGAAAVALVAALVRIRQRRALCYTALALSLAIAVGYSIVARSGNPEVDAVERFHFIEYGLITALLCRAWRPSQDGAVFVLPMLLALTIGTLEEWVQWFIPARVGEARDVLLNFFAIIAGALFSLGLDPPPSPTWRLGAASRRRAGVAACGALVVFAMFFHAVHLGHEIKDPDAGVFRSRYDHRALADVAAARREQWQLNPPVTWSRLSREDQYFSEGLAHVRRRNEAWDEGQLMAARHENLILEKYYAPVLDTPSHASATGLRWPPEQRAAAEQQRGVGFMIYVSDGNEYPIFVWSKWLFWTVVAAFCLVLLRSTRASA